MFWEVMEKGDPLMHGLLGNPREKKEKPSARPELAPWAPKLQESRLNRLPPSQRTSSLPCLALLWKWEGLGENLLFFSGCSALSKYVNFFLSLVESKSAFCAYWIVLNVAWLLYLVLVSGQKNVVTWYQWCLETSWSAFGKVPNVLPVASWDLLFP